jgi:N-carbamoylputrescine amidase
MLLVDAEVRESNIAGRGLFLRSPVRKGAVVSIHAADAQLLTQAEYQEEQRKGNELAIRSGMRWVGRYFLHAKKMPVESYINHSDEPTLLYHCGVSFARRDLDAGDELTIDYRLLLAEEDVEVFRDIASGRMLFGLPPKEALLRSAEELVHLLRELDESGLMDRPGKVRLALLQMNSGHDPHQNLERCLALVERAAKEGGQIIVLPELFRLPCFWRSMDYDHFESAESVPGPTTEALSKVAAALNVVVVASIFERRAAGVFHNSAAVIDADGRMLGLYRQMHVGIDPRSEGGFYFSPGDLGFKVFQTRYAKVGVLVGWDQWYPEAARISALAGAQILLYPSARWRSPGESELDLEHQYAAWETIQRSHAIANNIFVAAVNRVGSEEGPATHRNEAPVFWGRSFIADPSGRIAANGGATMEEIVTAECDLGKVAVVRTHWPFLRDRRLDAYASITAHSTE